MGKKRTEIAEGFMSYGEMILANLALNKENREAINRDAKNIEKLRKAVTLLIKEK